jgi:hypothetical protein
MEEPSGTASVPVWPAHVRTDWRLAMEWLDQDMDELERLLPSCGASAHGGISGVQTVALTCSEDE